MSKRIMYLSGQHGTGTPYDLPGYIYDPVNDEFTDMATGNKFDKSGGSVTLVDLTATENKTYTPDSGKAYGKVIVNVPGKTEQTKSETYTTNDTYTITPDEGKVLSSVSVTVSVPDAADLEANKAATIDVSQYTEPVEITPTEGKDGMTKATVTLSNIPSPTNLGYSWKMSPTGVTGKDAYVILPFGAAPETLTSHDTNDKCYSAISIGSGGDRVYTIRYRTIIPEAASADESYTNIVYTKTSDTVFTLAYDYTYDNAGEPDTEHYDFTFEYIRPIFSDNPWV